jgi:hypothetical protein
MGVHSRWSGDVYELDREALRAQAMHWRRVAREIAVSAARRSG